MKQRSNSDGAGLAGGVRRSVDDLPRVVQLGSMVIDFFLWIRLPPPPPPSHLRMSRPDDAIRMKVNASSFCVRCLQQTPVRLHRPPSGKRCFHTPSSSVTPVKSYVSISLFVGRNRIRDSALPTEPHALTRTCFTKHLPSANIVSVCLNALPRS